MASDLDFNIKIADDTKPLNAKQNNSSNYQSTQQIGEKPTQTPSNAYQQNFEKLQSNFDLGKSSHPVACIFTFVFKIFGMLSFLFLNLIMSNEVMTFIVVILSVAFDFWTVKNVTGRLLVGLRWWSDFKEDGSEVWYFESYDDKVQMNPVDSKFFWWSQYIAIIFWTLFGILDIIGFKWYWGTACIICFVLTGVNLWGYYKCSKDHQSKVKNLAGGMATNYVLGKVASYI